MLRDSESPLRGIIFKAEMTPRRRTVVSKPALFPGMGGAKTDFKGRALNKQNPIKITP